MYLTTEQKCPDFVWNSYLCIWIKIFRYLAKKTPIRALAESAKDLSEIRTFWRGQSRSLPGSSLDLSNLRASLKSFSLELALKPVWRSSVKFCWVIVWKSVALGSFSWKSSEYDIWLLQLLRVQKNFNLTFRSRQELVQVQQENIFYLWKNFQKK